MGGEAGGRRAMLTRPGRTRAGRWPSAPVPARSGLVRNAALVAASLVILVAGAVIVVMTSPDRPAGDFPSLFRPISMSFPWRPVGAKVEMPTHRNEQPPLAHNGDRAADYRPGQA